MKYYIRDKDWAIIYPNLSQERGIHTQKEERVKVFFEAIWYMCRTGCQWRLLPSWYGNWRAIHRRFFSLGSKGYLGTFIGKGSD